jgi:hypothetical protein
MMMRAAAHAAHIGLLCVFLPILLSASLPAGAAEPDERGLWELWQQHAQPPHDHKALLTACQAFNDKHPSDPLAVVSQTLAGWHLLQLGRQEDAVKVFVRLSKSRGSSLEDGGKTISLAWLTRMDRDRIKESLQFYYRRKMAYPAKLADLAAYPKLPESLVFADRDRWDSTWSYQLTGFRTIPNMLDQKYRLRSVRLGGGSDLAEALAVPCGGLLRIEPVRVSSSVTGMEVLELRHLPESEGGAEEAPAREKIMLKVGSRTESVFLAYVGPHLVIVSDYHHWKVLPRPRAN